MKRNVSLNENVIFIFHTIFKLYFITQFIYYIIPRCLCSHFILLLFSYQSLRDETQKQCYVFPIHTIDKMSEKKKPEVLEYGP